MNPVKETLTLGTRRFERSDDALDGSDRALHRDRGTLARKATVGHAIAAEIELVVWNELAVQPASFAIDADVAGLWLRATVVASRYADAQFRRSRFCKERGKQRAHLLAARDAQSARPCARARDHIIAIGRQVESDRADRIDHRRHLRLRHIADHEILVLRRTDLFESEVAQQRAQAFPLPGRYVSQRDADRHREESGLTLRIGGARRAGSGRKRVRLRRPPFGRRALRTGECLATAREFFVVASHEARLTEALDEELDPRLRAFGPIGMLVVQSDDRFHRRQQVGFRNKRIDNDGFARLVTEAAAGNELEARLPIALGGNDAEIVEHALRAIRFACRKADLELARQLLAQRIAQEMNDRALQMLGDIGPLARACARHRARGDVANGVRARLARCQVRLGETEHRFRRLAERDEMDLHRLPRRDVRSRVLRELAGDFADCIELIGVQRAAWRLDAQHVDAALPLSIGPHLQAQRSESIVGNLAACVGGDGLGVAFDLEGIGECGFKDESGGFDKGVHSIGVHSCGN